METPATHHNVARGRATVGRSGSVCLAVLLGLAAAGPTQAADPLTAPAQPAGREFRPGSIQRLDDLPPGRFRGDVESLPAIARDRAVSWLSTLHLPEADFEALQVDPEGGVYYADAFQLAPESPMEEAADPVTADAALPVSPFPASLVFHSRPGAPNVLFLNFCGEAVTNTAWNTGLTNLIQAMPFSADSDYGNFSDAEQLSIRRIWQRVSEDYSPFNVDVTTERPAVLGARVGMAVITRNSDASGNPTPSSSSGGVAYMSVFGNTDYARYRPAWVYANNLGNDESNIAEAAGHELGHNMGLSHDGLSGTEYYGGHGSGDISWGPIMGTGYGRNVSQWSKGEYYNSSNTQDDLAVIAGRLTYRTDDHGNTLGTATALVVSGGTNIVSTTPETDRTNTRPENKGVLQRTDDVDVFSFTTGAGAVSLAVTPWVVPSGRTKGGNVDLYLELRDSAGTVLFTNNPALQTTARIDATLAQGVYFLYVGNTGAGTPLVTSPTGYTEYGCVGQYFISGTVVPSDFVVPPIAELAANDLTLLGVPSHSFTVTYTDNLAMDLATLDDADVRVTGPGGFDQPARFVSCSLSTNGTPCVATYSVDAPNSGVWTIAENGDYTVTMEPTAVSDTEGAAVQAGVLGGFKVAIPHVLYQASMAADPGWTLEGQWQFGPPQYASGGPTTAYTGSNILGYNLAGDYASGLALTWATTPAFDCRGSTALTLRFRRWLGLKRSDTAVISASTDGSTWTEVWSTTGGQTDTSWQEVQYALPAAAAGNPAVRLRWGIASDFNRTDIGWNLDDVQVLGEGVFDSSPPQATLFASDLNTNSASPHSIQVSFADDLLVRRSTLGAGDLLVTGPNGYSVVAGFAEASPVTNAASIVARYEVAAPGGGWDWADNGMYVVSLVEGEVTDTAGNSVPAVELGAFAVEIPAEAVRVSFSATVNQSAWGTVSPASSVFDLNSLITITATPAPYFRFERWTGDASGSANPLSLVMSTNLNIQAEFAEVLTVDHPTPYWWLAAHGITADFEASITNTGANGVPLWQSYVAGLTPEDPASQLRLQLAPSPDAGEVVLNWNTVNGRLYSILGSDSAEGPYQPLPGATDLAAGVQSLTNVVTAGGSPSFYRLEVRLP